MKKHIVFLGAFLMAPCLWALGGGATDTVQPVIVVNCPDGAAANYSGVAQPVTMSNVCAPTSFNYAVHVTTGGSIGFEEYQIPAYVDKSTVTWTNGNEQTVTLTANVTFVFNAPTYSANLTLRIATGSGSFTGAWPNSVLWSGGTAPTLTATASKNDIVSCHYSAATTKYYCVWTGNF